MSAPDFAKLAPEYFRLFITCRPRDARLGELDQACRRILRGRERYEAVARTLPNPPWWFIGLMHELECSCSFNHHLHNGDPLSHRTVNVPAGRPLKMPCTWAESAWDAITYDKLQKWSDWSVAGALYKLEAFNGYGYHGKGINSPYLWAGSQHYTQGKYVRDGVYDPYAVSKQLGAAVILHHLCAGHAVALAGQPIHPAA